jgi:hypothetical protein
LRGENFRIKIGSAFLCYFLLQKQKKVEDCLVASANKARQGSKDVAIYYLSHVLIEATVLT